MIIGIGNDIVEVKRIKRATERTESFVDKLLTAEEKERVIKVDKIKFESIAGIFAAKEAVSKALGTGFVAFELRDIEVRKDKNGKPWVKLYGGALELCNQLGATHIHLTISHTKEYATAVAILEKGN